MGDRVAPGVLVVVAHPDDETFGCGSLLLHARAAGARTAVICATRGESGEVEPGVEAPGGVAALREGELRAAAEALGVSDVRLLDLTDSGMAGEPDAGSVCGVSVERLAAAVAEAAAGLRVDLVITLDGSDGHRDHLHVRAAVEQLWAGSPVPVYLQCLPRSLMHDWVRYHAGDQSAASYTELPDIGTPDAELTTVLDTAEHFEHRESAIELHRSQRSPFAGLPDPLRRAFLAREHLIRVNPPWSGGPRETELLGLGAGTVPSA